ncbi:MAG: hypothetical protein EOP11_01685 [Proteobacteria bacterium]|nr:MAG: hypothetical protein EOP11_01685 [Pseudomonadota bacterium]
MARRFIGLSLILSIAQACGAEGGLGLQGDSSLLDKNLLNSPVSRLEMIPANPVVAPGETVQFVVNAVAYDGTRRDVTSLVTWLNSDANHLGADAAQAHKFIAATPGLSTVTASLAAYSISADVTITAATLVSLQFVPALPSLPKGSVHHLNLVGVFSDGTSQVLTDQATWATDNSGVAAISDAVGSKGFLNVANSGAAVITASLNGISHSANLNATNATLNSLHVVAPAQGVPAGMATNLSVVGSYSDGSTADLTFSATWESSDTLKATANFSGMAGSFLGLNPGVVTATARVGGQSASATLSIVTATLSSLTVAPPAATIPAGTTQDFTVAGHFSDGSIRDLTGLVAWTSDAASSALPVNAAPGTFRGVAAGRAQAIASYNGTTAAADLDVTSAVLTGLSISSNAPTVAKGLSASFTALGTFSDGSTMDVTDWAAWAVSNPALGTISNVAGNKGRFASLDTGTLTVSAELFGVQASLSTTVSSATLNSLTLTSSASHVAKGLSAQLTATGTFTDGSSADLTSLATFTSNTPALASISDAAVSKGFFRGMDVGAASVSANYGGFQATRSITVDAAILNSVAVSALANNLAKGLGTQLAATAIYSDGSSSDITATASWASDANSVGTVSNASATKGLFQSVTIGTVNLAATFGGKQGSTAINVGAAAQNGLTLTPASPQVAKGLNTQLTATASYTDGSTGNVTAQAMFSSGTPGIASVSDAAGSKGLFVGLNAGAATANASFGGFQASASVTVDAATLTALAVSPASGTVAKGSTLALSATATYSDGTTADVTSTATWVTNSSARGTINTSGLFTGVNTGAVSTMASFGGMQANASLMVSAAALTGLSVTGPASHVAKGLTLQLNAVGSYSDGSTADLTAQANWSSASANLGVSDAAASKGLASGINAGAGAVNASFGGFQGALTITVDAAVVSGLSVTAASPTVAKGLTTQLTATAIYSDGTTANVSGTAAWSSSAATRGTVNTSGLFNGLNVGAVTATAAFGGSQASVSLTVDAAALTALAVTSAGNSVAAGQDLPLTATGTYSDGSTADLTAVSAWVSASSAVGTVSGAVGTKGVFHGLTAGSSVVSATYGGFQGTRTITVSAPVLTGIAVSAASSTVAKGLSTQLTATATYSDGSTANVTAAAAWASNAPAIGTVSNTSGTKGLFQTVAVGPATITASFGGQQASAAITVSAPTVVSLAVNPPSITVVVLAVRNFQAFATYTDGSVVDVTNSANWSSSNTGLLTVSNSGSVRGQMTSLTLGDTVVTATFGGRSATSAVHSVLF